MASLLLFPALHMALDFSKILGEGPPGGQLALHGQLAAQGDIRSWQLFP